VTTVSETVRALYTIRDLGWPIALLDLAIGVMRDHGRVAPVYFCGSERGYEAESYPGLYDPSSGGQVGPLINALESYSVTPTLGEQMNHVPVSDADSGICDSAVEALRIDCGRAPSSTLLRQRLNEISSDLLASLVARTAPTRLARIVRLSTPYNSQNPEHQMIDRAIRTRLSSGMASGHPVRSI
jgi:hypothetical protein